MSNQYANQYAHGFTEGAIVCLCVCSFVCLFVCLFFCSLFVCLPRKGNRHGALKGVAQGPMCSSMSKPHRLPRLGMDLCVQTKAYKGLTFLCYLPMACFFGLVFVAAREFGVLCECVCLCAYFVCFVCACHVVLLVLVTCFGLAFHSLQRLRFCRCVLCLSFTRLRTRTIFQGVA